MLRVCVHRVDCLQLNAESTASEPSVNLAEMEMIMRTKIDSEKLYWAAFNRFELRLPGECVADCSHQGDCDADVQNWVDKVRAQIEADNFTNKPTSEKFRAELSEYGAWDEIELADDAANFKRLIWIAAGNISDAVTPDCSEPVK